MFTRTHSQCHLFRGVHPVLYEDPKVEDWTEDVEKRFLAGIDKGKREGFIGTGSSLIMVSGWRPGPANINTIRVFVYGE